MGGSAFVIRHARAGRRSAWHGPDEMRPLSGPGRRQARAIARMLRDEPITRVVSSPFARCVQTVEALAAGIGVTVEEDAMLAEGRGIARAETLARSAGDTGGVVLSSHGDVILGLLDALGAAGVSLDGEPVAKKGSTWIFDVHEGAILHGTYVPPPGER